MKPNKCKVKCYPKFSHFLLLLLLRSLQEFTNVRFSVINVSCLEVFYEDMNPVFSRVISQLTVVLLDV